jgi:outer membrane protein assembly factor BamB
MRLTNYRAKSRLAAALATIATIAAMSPAFAQGATTPATPAADAWLTYKGDAQRTNSRAVRLGAPLNLLWRHSPESPPGEFVTSPLVTGTADDRRIYVATADAMYCIEASTGERIWHSAMTIGNIASPLTMLRSGDTDLLLGVTANDNVIAVRASDGTLIWQYTARTQARAGLPAVVRTTRGDRIVVALGDGRLGALTPTGEVDPDWNVRLGRRIADPSSTPALSRDGKLVFVTARDRNVYALNTETGATVYTFELESSAQLSPVVVQDTLIVIARNTMSAHSVQDGKQLWELDLRDSVLASPAAMTSGGRSTIYVGTRNGTLSAIDAATGNVAWSINVEASITTTPTVVSDLVLVGTGNGLLIGVKPEDGSIVWQYRLHTTRTTTSTTGGTMTGAATDATGATTGGAFITGAAQFGPGVGDTTTIFPPTGTATPGTAMPGTAVPGTTLPPVPDTLAPAVVTQTYGISATPVVVDGKLFVLGDNAALYAFDAAPRDVLPPRAVAPSLSTPDTLGQLTPALLETATPRAIPGQAPIFFAVELADTGSGINPFSIQVTLNKQPVATSRIFFQRSSGVLTVTLAEKVPLNKGNLPDGQYNIGVTARDYRNNEMTYSTSFMVDNSLPLPTGVPPQPVMPPTPPSATLPPITPPPVAPGGNVGGGGFGGGGF